MDTNQAQIVLSAILAACVMAGIHLRRHPRRIQEALLLGLIMGAPIGGAISEGAIQRGLPGWAIVLAGPLGFVVFMMLGMILPWLLLSWAGLPISWRALSQPAPEDN